MAGASSAGTGPRALSSSPWRALILVTLASTCFASIQAGVKFLGAELKDQVGPLAALASPVFARGLVGVLVLGLWSRARGRSLRPRGRWRLLLRCVAGGVAMLSLYYSLGVLHLELGTASMLLKTAPLWVAVLAPFALREPTGARGWLAVAVGALGVTLIYWRAPTGEMLAVSLCLLSGLLAAVAYMALRGLASTDDPPTVVFAFSLFLALGSAPFLLPFLRGASHYGLGVWVALAVAGIGGTGGQLLLTEAYRWGTATLVTLGGLTGVVAAMLLDLALFGKFPPLQAVVGGSLAVSAGVIAGLGRKPEPTKVAGPPAA